MDYTLFNLFAYFMFYSIAGWVLESVYRSFCEKRFVNTGFLNGPFCPIYGIGTIIMLLFLKDFQKNVILLFIISFLMLSAWEYVVGVLLEKIFKTRYWDYSDHKINIKGRVCLFNSVCWGIIGVLFIKYIHPFIEKNMELVNPFILKNVVLVITILFIIDTIISIVSTINIKTALQKIEELNNQIKEKLDEVKTLTNKEIKTELVDGIQNKIDILKKKKNRLFRRLYRRVYRLKKAFPDLQSNEITEVLSKKIEFIKKDKTKEEK